ncbi:MAG TPA: Flp family type IVb pilin [Janthinobacterium sp.]|nr:Flp family type IVb pilin [Janthinobacterium sp.]
MNTFLSAAKQFIDDEDGVTAIEYGLIAALIVAALASTLTGVTNALKGKFTAIVDALTAP